MTTKISFITRQTSYAVMGLGLLLASGCASVPKNDANSIKTEHGLETIRAEKHRRIEQYIDNKEISTIDRIALPNVIIGKDAFEKPITPRQALIVANNAARSFCNELAPYVVLAPASTVGTSQANITINRIQSTSSGAAGLSSLMGLAVPGPFRLPVGLGALSAEAELLNAQLQQVFYIRWARGANAVMDDAKVSAIGDSWQIARKFGEEIAETIMDNDKESSGIQRNKLEDLQIQSNRELCDATYGKLKIAARGASLFLPLSPESIDPGPPDQQNSPVQETPLN